MMKKTKIVMRNGKPVSVQKYDLAVKLASAVLGTPPGSWPETQQAALQLRESLPKNLTYGEAIELARAAGAHIHPDRR